MTPADEAALIGARTALPVLLTTVAPESVRPQQVAALVEAGVVVSLSHTDTSYAVARTYGDSGASVVTHIFNAMSQLGSREPGLVGAAIAAGGLHAGLIPDGVHVEPAAIRSELRAKQRPRGIFLVTDAMDPLGTEMDSFTLSGRNIYRRDGSVRLADGTL